jgi:hypothetical protein
MKLPKWPWWAWAIVVLVGLGIISAIVSPPEQTAQKGPAGPQPVNFRQVDAIGSYRDLGSEAYSVIIEAGSDFAMTEAAARGLCRGKTFCQVFGFSDASAKPSAMPMTDREAQALIYTYTLSRSAGTDESVGNCAFFPSAPKDRCTADATATPPA